MEVGLEAGGQSLAELGLHFLGELLPHGPTSALAMGCRVSCTWGGLAGKI